MIKINRIAARQGHQGKKIPKPSNGRLHKTTVMIPRHKVMMKYMRFPSYDAAEIKDMIRLQITGLVPYTPEEVVFDFYEIKRDAAGHTHGLVVIAVREIIGPMIDRVRSVKSGPVSLTVSSFGLLARINHELSRQAVDDQGPVLAVHVAPQAAEICVCLNRKLYFSRSVLISDQEDVGTLSREIGSTLKICRQETGLSPDRAILFSAPEGLKTILQEGYGLSAKEWFDEDLDSLVPGQDAVNLVPPEVMADRDRYRRRKALVQCFGMLVVMLGIGFGALGAHFAARRGYLSSIERQIKVTEQGMERERLRLEAIRDVQNKIRNRVLLADMVKEIYRLFPEDMTLDMLRLDADGNLVLEGTAATQKDVNTFQKHCVASGLFKDVTLLYATKRRKFNVESTEFKIKCQVSPS